MASPKFLKMPKKTYRNGWIKRHKGKCGGLVIFTENVEDSVHWEWDLHCIECDTDLPQEDIDFIKD